ncbi:MAG: hypothetical protein WKF73_07940 [Nocardioidaceae bacterium]
MAPLTVPLYAILARQPGRQPVHPRRRRQPAGRLLGAARRRTGSPGPDRCHRRARDAVHDRRPRGGVVGFKAGLFNIGAEGQLLLGALTAAWVGTWSWLAGASAAARGARSCSSRASSAAWSGVASPVS